MFGIRPIPGQNMAGWYSSIWDRRTEPLFPMYDIIDTGTTPDECAFDLCAGVF
jgi:hypothetical protein